MASRAATNKYVPTVERGILQYEDDDGEYRVKLGSKTWENWLATATRFYVQTAEGRLIVRKEGQRGGPYWWAYRRQGSIVKRLHLGKDDALSMEQFEAAAVELTYMLAALRAVVPPTYRSGWFWDPQSEQPVWVGQTADGWHARFVAYDLATTASDSPLCTRIEPLTKDLYTRLVPLGRQDEGKREA